MLAPPPLLLEKLLEVDAAEEHWLPSQVPQPLLLKSVGEPDYWLPHLVSTSVFEDLLFSLPPQCSQLMHKL